MFVTDVNNINKLLDSGERTEFEGGAKRDMHEGKGRCDLVPWEALDTFNKDEFLRHAGYYIRSGNTRELFSMIEILFNLSGKHSSTFLLELSMHYEAGAKKYDDRNWELGVPIHSFIDSAIRHYLKYMRDDEDEPHLIACMWNLTGALWTQHNHPELMDLPINDVQIEMEVK